MSSSSSQIPDEKSAGIKKAAMLKEELVSEDLQLFALMRKPMERYTAIQERVADAQAQLGNDIVPLDFLNTNTGLVAQIKAQLRKEAGDFIQNNKAMVAEKNLRTLLDDLVKKHPEDLFLKELDRTLHYHQLNNLSQNQNSSSSSSSSSSEPLSNNRIGGLASAIRDGMLQILVEKKATELLIPTRLKLAQDYYGSIIINYLHKKMYEAYQKETKLNTKHPVIEDLLKNLKSLLYKPYDKSVGNSDFVNLLKQIVMTPYSVPLVKNKETTQVKISLLKASAVTKLKEMEDLLRDNYNDFSKFELRMSEFRNKQYSRWQRLLYSLLPDTTAKNSKSKQSLVDEMAADVEANYFPDVKDETERQLYHYAYKAYARQSQSRDQPANQAELTEYRKILASNFDTAIENNFSDGAMGLLVINLKNILKIEDNVLGMIVAIMVKVLANPPAPEAELADPKFEAIFQEVTVLALVEKLKLYSIDKSPGYRKLKDHLAMYLVHLHIPESLANLLEDNAKVEKFKKDIQQYYTLQHEYDKAEKMQLDMHEEASKRIDGPLINLLRAQVLHAATLYYNPAEKPGLMHRLHHGFSGRQGVLDLIHQLFSPELKTFAAAVSHLRSFIARHKQTQGLHTNSFDTLLSFVLYNEGQPRGLFNLPLTNVMTFDFKRFYPNFDPADLHYRKQHDEITSADVEIMKAYLKDNFKPDEVSMRGQVTNMVRGPRRLESEAELNIVRQELVNNLVNRAILIEQFKAGQALHIKVESAQTAQNVKR